MSAGDLLIAVVIWTCIISVTLGGILLTWAAWLAWQDHRDDLRSACQDARKLGEIAELEMSYKLPSAPGSPRWTR